MDAGGLAQMTYTSPFNNGLGMPNAGFAARGKAPHIKRLNVQPLPRISTDESQHAVSTPRTSRGHLLAGLRTAPKSATVNPTFQMGLENSKYATTAQAHHVPQTATGAFFPQGQGMSMNSGRQMYSLPEHVLAPPSIDFDEGAGEEIDPRHYEELMATNAFLAQQQRILQQQLLSVTAAAQQFGGLNLGGSYGQQNQQMTYYNQQLQQGLQPVVQAVPNNPGVYSVYNPMTGQQSYVVDPNLQQQQEELPTPSYQKIEKSPSPPTPSFRFTPPQASVSPAEAARAKSPKSSPQDVEPLPPPSANAFRRGHHKSVSSVTKTILETKPTGPKSAGFPQTPMTGTFGPGQARAGEHPVRQPKGPPSIDELVAKPTTKHEGSKNFTTRQRRRAVHNLVRAGMERRTERTGGSGSATPSSENEFNFSVSSDNDELIRSTSGELSSKPSNNSIRSPGVIGSERKEKSRERGSVGSASGSDEYSIGGNTADVESRRNASFFLLNSAEKRRNNYL